jgi:AcrR family transcriptional regulator
MSYAHLDMIHIMKEKHAYSSRLRQEQMNRTREQILEGLVRTMSHGITELSIPTVAREAGVSVPTVYRYFRTKRDLVEALGGYLLQKIGFGQVQPPQSPEELAAMVKKLFISYEGLDETLRAAAVSEFAYETRKEALPARLKIIEEALAPVRTKFNEKDWVRLRNIVLVLSSTATVRAFKDYLDLSGEEAADIVTWAILRLTQTPSRADETTP